MATPTRGASAKTSHWARLSRRPRARSSLSLRDLGRVIVAGSVRGGGWICCRPPSVHWSCLPHGRSCLEGLGRVGLASEALGAAYYRLGHRQQGRPALPDRQAGGHARVSALVALVLSRCHPRLGRLLLGQRSLLHGEGGRYPPRPATVARKARASMRLRRRSDPITARRPRGRVVGSGRAPVHVCGTVSPARTVSRTVSDATAWSSDVHQTHIHPKRYPAPDARKPRRGRVSGWALLGSNQ